VEDQVDNADTFRDQATVSDMKNHHGPHSTCLQPY
jgi:hypothetical protein